MKTFKHSDIEKKSIRTGKVSAFYTMDVDAQIDIIRQDYHNFVIERTRRLEQEEEWRRGMEEFNHYTRRIRGRFRNEDL